MIEVVKPTRVNGKVKAPASKSFMQRAIALAILAGDSITLENPSTCNDGLAAIDIARKFGFKVDVDKDKIKIEPIDDATPAELNCGEAGLGIRMFTPLAALNSHKITLKGEGSLLTRPVDFMEHTLSQLGVKVETLDGKPPISVHGPILGGKAMVDGSTSSQFLTGLLISLPKAEYDSELHVDKLMSIPYIDMTLKAVADFGVEIVNEDYKVFKIKGKQQYSSSDYLIEGDWSGAAGLLIAGAIGGEIIVDKLQANSTQADKAVLEALEKAGAIVTESNDCYTVKQPDTPLKAFEMDATHCPDLFPVLASLASNCEGVTRIKGIHRLTHKESNRALTVQQEFKKLGIEIELDDAKDEMSITGGKISGGVTVSSHNDHRIAMAMALAAVNADGEITIEGAECVAKSYPEFFEDFRNFTN